MTSALVRCPVHGQFERGINDLVLHHCTSNRSLTFYTFTCPICGPVQKLATVEVVSILTAAGAGTRTWTVPAEALEPHAGPAFTLDDLIAFHFELAQVNA